MGIYDLKSECLTFLRNVCNHKYEGELAEQFKKLKSTCESRRWAMESSMETEADMVQWISELDAALAAFQKATRPEDNLRLRLQTDRCKQGEEREKCTQRNPSRDSLV